MTVVMFGCRSDASSRISSSIDSCPPKVNAQSAQSQHAKSSRKVAQRLASSSASCAPSVDTQSAQSQRKVNRQSAQSQRKVNRQSAHSQVKNHQCMNHQVG
eukprot:3074556-Rhodomonas_salina.1